MLMLQEAWKYRKPENFRGRGCYKFWGCKLSSTDASFGGEFRHVCAFQSLTDIQILRSRRIFSHTGSHTAPDVFLFLILLPESTALNKHLVSVPDMANLRSDFFQGDHICLSHFHRTEDGLPNTEDDMADIEHDNISQSSIVGCPKAKDPGPEKVLFPVGVSLLVSVAVLNSFTQRYRKSNSSASGSAVLLSPPKSSATSTTS